MPIVTATGTQKDRAHTAVVFLRNAATVTAGNGDVIEFWKVKEGDNVIDGAVWTEGTSTTTYTVGDGGSAARFMASTVVTNSGRYAFNVAPSLSSGNVATGGGYKYPANDTVDITVGVAGITSKVIRGYLMVIREF
jgi:hypothetical protein